MEKNINELLIGPSVMPVDRDAWVKELNRSNFLNAFYQFKDIQQCEGSNILIVGVGQGLDSLVLRWKGFNITTFDIDYKFEPDYVGSVHDMSIFENKKFDIVIASHVLEHLPLEYLDASISELHRVAKYALVYLPVAGRHGHLKFSLGIKNFGFDLVWDIFNYFKKPKGNIPSYCDGQHFWEIGRPGFRVGDIKIRLSKKFEIINSYRNIDWLPSYNFVLRAL
jgi:hypothetical protein